MRRRRVRAAGPVVLLLLLVAVGVGRAQDYDDDSDAVVAKWAQLRLQFDAHGGADLHLSLMQKPDSWEAIRAALAQMLHCPASQFANPSTRLEPRVRRSMSEQQWERYRKAVADADQMRLNGSCTGFLAAAGSVEQGSLEMAPLAAALRQAGIEKLSVSLAYPAAAFHEFSGEGLADPASDSYARYTFDLRGQAALAPIRIAFGFRPRDLKRAGLIALGFVLVPIVIILWMRRVTLRAGGEDPFAAWFSYHRTVNWCVTGTILLWVFSDFQARRTLDRYVDFRWGAESLLEPLASAALIFVPILAVYAASVVVSYPVFVRLRGTAWKRREYLLVQLLQGGATLLPLMFMMAGILLFLKNAQVAIASFVLAYVSYLICSSWKLRVARTFPQAVTTGELRDKIFVLAKQAAVTVRQVFVLPAGKGQIANAFAAKNNLVIFTDYLLQKLSKREVNAVAAHELTHLQNRHPGKLQAALLAAIFAPTWVPWALSMGGGMAMSVALLLVTQIAGSRNTTAFVLRWERAWLWLSSWQVNDLLLIALGFTAFYFLSRRFEFAADAGAVRLTGDPEAAITALLKLNRLNLMPVQWGRVSGAWLTHPTTLRRVERIAQLGRVAPERLRQILEQYSSPAAAAAEEEHYQVPVSDDKLLSYRGQTARSRVNLWVLITFHWLPAAATSWLIEWRHWQGGTRSLAYLLGLGFTLGLYLFLMRWLGVRGRREIEERLLDKARCEGIPVQELAPLTVGLSPGPTPRFYVTSYNWDTGLLFLTRDRLYFLGGQLRCVLTRAQVTDLQLGPGAPSWVAMPRTYLRWKDEAGGQEGTLNLASAQPCASWELGRKARELFDQLSQWKQGRAPAAAMAHLETLGPPVLSEVTSMSPKTLSTPGKSLKTLLVLILPVAIGGCVLLRVPAIWYVCLVTLLTRLFELVPHWRYRERPVFAVPAPAAAGAAAAPSASR